MSAIPPRASATIPARVMGCFQQRFRGHFQPAAGDRHENERPLYGTRSHPRRVANSSPKGTLRVLIHDDPTDDVDEVWVQFDEVSAHSVDDGWLVVSEVLDSVDLLLLQDGVVDELGLANLPVGDYDQIRLHIDDAWVVADGANHELSIPSGDQSGIKIPVE
ncbi:MAG: DUF4382 domain-containing protein, partial [Deltaproteobacteria bacterium]|nr:DUF4382 domain-containing protein [Deltaproteobacteria bacterium]